MLVLDLNTTDYVLLGALGLLFLAQLYFYARYMAAPARLIRRDKKANSQKQTANSSAETLGVSVIIAAHNERYNLSQYLQALLSQDWPTYEVIVVDDGSEDETRAIVESYMVNDPRLRMTFVPYGARVRSTKKLALTLGAKAAKYDYLLSKCQMTNLKCQMTSSLASAPISVRKDISTALCVLIPSLTDSIIWEQPSADIPIWASGGTWRTAKNSSLSRAGLRI